MRAFSLTISCILLLLATGHSQLREFEDSYGRVIKAKLVSHKGAKEDSVTIAKADGKEFEVKIAMFSTGDQTFIKEWMKETPASINYTFRIEANKKPGDTKNKDYYALSVTNLSHDTSSNFTVKARLFLTNRRPLTAEGWYHYGGEVYAKEQSFEVEGEVRFNQKAKIRTPEHYRLFGIFVRVHDKSGKVVAEEKIGTPRVTKLAWDDGKKHSSLGEEPGGKSKLTID